MTATVAWSVNVGEVVRFRVRGTDGLELAYCHVWIVGSNAEVFDLFVRRDYRGNGYAKALVDSALKYCKLHGVKIVQAHVDPENLPSSGVFSGRHFKMTGMEMHMEIRL